MRPRVLARRLVLQYLFMVDLAGGEDAQSAEEFLAEHSSDETVLQMATMLIRNTLSDLPLVDQALRDCASHWELERIAGVERNVLRMAYTEMRMGKTPPKVVMNEAVLLAKKFGGKESGGFVNGILDSLYRGMADGEEA